MNAWESPGAAAVHQLLDAGTAEMAHALPLGAPKSYARELAAVVWRAMLLRARP